MRKKKLKELVNQLNEGIVELFDSEEYENYLNVMSRFHRYSFNNTVLIYKQNRDAKLVAGYCAWQNDFNRHVKKGEKAIRILAPMKMSVENEDGDTEEVLKFRTAYVFDISQTEGQPLPSVIDHDLSAPVPSYDSFLDALLLVSPVPIVFRILDDEVNGFYHLKEDVIVIKKGMSPLKTLKTLLHEMAHAYMHVGKDFDEVTREVQAESVAYVILKHYGFDTGGYSFGYIGLWAKDRAVDELSEGMDSIVKTSNHYIELIDHVRSEESGIDYVYEQVALANNEQ